VTLRNAIPDAAKGQLLSVIARLEPFDQTALLAALSGLALMPENASRHLRLNTLIELAASLPADGGKTDPGANQLRRLVNSAEVRDLLGMLEDPAEYPLTEPSSSKGAPTSSSPGSKRKAATGCLGCWTCLTELRRPPRSVPPSLIA